MVIPGKKLVMPKYCESTHQTKRRPTRTVEVRMIGDVLHVLCFTLVLQIGKVKVGSEHPIALQTMTTTDTRDVAKTVEQVCNTPLCSSAIK